ncbi:MAG: hypothetical protein J7L95_01335, partial [Prolixibacteraceae bacterium]|nr:hypothetical protein [Prolixibacteraceae bacterium]
NPGVAFDAGFTFQIDKNSLLAGNINDVGAIWFRKNSWKLAQSGSQLFRGINLSLATDSKKDNGYIAPIITMLNTKDSLRSVFEPFADSTKFLSALSPKLLLHYNRKLPNGFRAGITAQAVFLKPFVAHSLTFTVLHPVNQFSVWADISEHQLASVSVGGGIQLNTKYAQLFAGIDNFPALYHPATQKAFAATLGMNFLIQQKKIKTKRRKRKGKTDEYFPFYLEHR